VPVVAVSEGAGPPWRDSGATAAGNATAPAGVVEAAADAAGVAGVVVATTGAGTDGAGMTLDGPLAEVARRTVDASRSAAGPRTHPAGGRAVEPNALVPGRSAWAEPIIRRSGAGPADAARAATAPPNPVVSGRPERTGPAIGAAVTLGRPASEARVMAAGSRSTLASSPGIVSTGGKSASVGRRAAVAAPGSGESGTAMDRCTTSGSRSAATGVIAAGGGGAADPADGVGEVPTV
jgi:hypothetical protein